MILLGFSITWALTIAILLFRAIRQYSFYEVVEPDDSRPHSDEPAKIAVVIPARNERENIVRCINALRDQVQPPMIAAIVVVDDRSTDDTADRARQIAVKDSGVRLIEGAEPPPGWAGKPHACWQGAQAAEQALGLPDESHWLCFMDADTAAEPPLINTACQIARRRMLDMLSFEPEQELAGPWERLIMPAGFFLIAFTQDVRRANDPTSPDAHANGQFMLFRRSAYNAIGGYASIKTQLSDDSALARRIKHARGKVAVLGTKNLIRTRMYRDLPSLWQGLSRQAGQILGSAPACLLAGIFALALAWITVLLPILASIASWRHGPSAVTLIAVACAFAGSLALFGTHIGAARYFKIPLWYGILFPVGYTLGAGIAFQGAIGFWRKKVVWKGRVMEAVPIASFDSPAQTHSVLGSNDRAIAPSPEP